jgi:3-deoxy-manno-octulosonate cytidylyltransferase (CMP-KDO synthetase)
VGAFHVVIPARYASTRLPGKPLLDLGGRPMVQRVVERAAASRAVELWVATDDERIAAAVHDPRAGHGGASGRARSIALLTDPALPSGTDRVAAVARARGWPDDAIVVNVQGDEPFVLPALIDQVAELLARDPGAAIATLAVPIDTLDDFLDPNVVKVVVADDGAALYFSRAPIPWTRDAAPAGLGSQAGHGDALRHVGMYAYRVGSLRRITGMAPSRYEQREKLEQLRPLQAGLRIVVGVCAGAPGPGIDTEADLWRARERVARQGD